MALALGFALAACVPRARTEVMVVFDADRSVRDRAEVLHIDFRSGTTELDRERSWDVPLNGWPRQLGVVPLEGGSGRRFEIEATALDGSNQVLGRVRALSSFVRGRTAQLRLVFEDCCEAVYPTCTLRETCRSCACTSYEIDPRTLPDLDVDAGADVGGDARSVGDGFSPIDAFVPPPDVHTVLPDAAPPPILPEGALCDLEDVRDHCQVGTVCTCDNPTGCTPTAPPARCIALSQINCARPIDLTARVLRVSPFTIELDGSTAPNLTVGTCGGGAPVPDLLYVVRNTSATPMRVNLDSDASIDFWFSCRLDFPWSEVCSPRHVLTIEAAGTASDTIYIFVEEGGPSILQVTRT